MTIKGVRTFLVDPSAARAGFIGHKQWLFVRLEADDGLVGWGESYTLPDRDRSIEQLVHELGRYLEGASPFTAKHFLQMVYDDFAARRGSMDLYCAASGLEQAMWDLAGKRLGVPVYQMLGGPCRPRIRVYANGWYAGCRTPEDLARAAREVKARGFRALKFDPFPGPWRSWIDAAAEEQAVANVRAVREAVGPDFEVLIEAHRRLAPAVARSVGKKLAPLRPFWYEEPVPPENLPALAEVRRDTGLPIVTGEALYTKAAFREVFERRAADIINPDVCNCGGILELKEIGAMAEPWMVAVAPHNYNSTTVALAASVQAAAVMPNFLILEYFVNFEETGREIAQTPLEVRDGAIDLPTRPGLGVDLREDELAKRPYREGPARGLPGWEAGTR
jgi:galactonate dehydratase